MPLELILASQSPRRRWLLEEAGILFRAVSPRVEEATQDSHPDLTPPELAKLNARMKAECVACEHPNAVVLAADTVVVCGGKVFGKPADRNDAVRMLTELSGRTHEVITAVIWLNHPANAIKEFIGRTCVTFKPLSERDISAYLDQVSVMDKAGAYALQEQGGDIVERIEGSRTNVIGLPMDPVRQWWQLDYQSAN